MKPIYKSLALAAMTLQVSLALQAQVNDGESVTESVVQAESLDGLKVELLSPNVTGVRDLIASGECEIDGEYLHISLNAGGWIKGATYSVRVSAVFGTQTVVLYVLNVSVPRYDALANETQEYEDEIVVVSTFGDGDKSGADASVYAKDDDDNAHIMTPLSVGNGAASGYGTIAGGFTVEANSHIKASGSGAIAGGFTVRANSHIEASGDGAVAIGCTYPPSGNVEASGAGSQAFGIGVQATRDGQTVCGKCNVIDENDDYQFIVGNGADNGHRSNTFAALKSGGISLFKADGTAVTLTATQLEALIALLPSA